MTSNFKNRFNQVPSVTEYPLIKRIRTDTTIDLSKILPRRVTQLSRLENVSIKLIQICGHQTLFCGKTIMTQNVLNEKTPYTVLRTVRYKGGPVSGDPSTMDLGYKIAR